MEDEDAILLRRFATDRSEEAFAVLVQRHLTLVYSAAFRRLGGDVHRASDVTQIVFASLARDAARLSHHPALAGWLYAAARHTAIDIIRAEKRRQAREQEVHAMHESSDEAPDWHRLRPVIDDALDTLSEDDRQVVLLRYFEARRFAEIGRVFGISEEAARKRADRALDSLKRLLARRGITSTTTALGLLLEAGAIEAAPVGLASSVIATAAPMAGVAAGFMVLTKIHVAGFAALLVVGGTTLLWQHQQILALRRANRATEAQLAQMTTELRDRSPRRTPAEAEINTLHAALSPTRTADTVKPREGFLAHPDVRATLREAVNAARTAAVPDPKQMARLHDRYDPLLKQRGLTPEQMDHWIAVMAEKDSINQDLQDAVRQFNLRGDATDLDALRSDLVAPYWKELYGMLGPGGDRAFGEYEKTSYFRSYLGMFTGDLTAANARLSDEQSAQLVRTIMANHSTVRVAPTDLGSHSVIDWPSVLRQSSGYLTSAQQAVLAHVIAARKPE